MTDLKTLALQSDPIQGEITEILSPELRAHVQKLIDAAVVKERAERDRLREALSNLVYACEKSRIWNGMGWTYHPVHPVHYQKRMEEGRQALAGSR